MTIANVYEEANHHSEKVWFSEYIHAVFQEASEKGVLRAPGMDQNQYQFFTVTTFIEIIFRDK